LTMVSEGRIDSSSRDMPRGPAVRLFALAHALCLLSGGPAPLRVGGRVGHRATQRESAATARNAA